MMQGNGKEGLKTAVAESFDPAQAPPDSMAGEQVDLFLPLHNVSDGKIARERGLPARRGAGRPPGSKNKNTEAWREYILARYPSPLVGLAETYSRPVEDLAADLRCSRKDAYVIQLQCMNAVLPYVHQKQPQAVDLGDGGLMTLVIGKIDVKSAAEVSELGLEPIDLDIEENQGFIGPENQKSNGAESNETPESGAGQGFNGDRATDQGSV